MKRSVKAAASVAAISLVAVPAVAQQSGPKAVYWVDAATTSGMGAGGGMGGMSAQAMAGQYAPPPEAQDYEEPSAGMAIGGALGGDAGAVIGGLFGGGKKKKAPPAPQQRAAAPAPRPAMRANYTHTLNLHLGSTQKAAGEPAAEHLPPAGLQTGALPLVTPRSAPPVQTQPYQNYGGGQPKGKMLIYWGCGEHAAGPPITIDLAKIGPGMKTSPFPVINVNVPTPPAPGKTATYGTWPNERSTVTVPETGSLAGAHTVKGNYSPPISFSVDPGHDFLAPLTITGQNPSPGGGRLVTWNAVPNATGYYAYMMGSTDGETMVMWSSSATAGAFGPLMDYVPPAEVRRLIGMKAVLPPTTTSCIVPSEVMQAAPMGMLMMIAYGDELNVSNPPKPAKGPWNIDYTVKLRLKSTTSTMLGMPSFGG